MTKKILPILLGFTLLFALIFSVCFWQSNVVKGAEPEFYAVFNTAVEGTKPANTLSFYYDTNKESYVAPSTSIYTKLPTEATKATDWSYDDTIRDKVANVVIDPSVANYHGLKSTVCMFLDMVNACNISGCEYLDVSNVTNMAYMFFSFASESETITAVPNVSNWNTGNVTNMECMFNSYGSNSKVICAVPDVSNWDTGNVTNMEAMFATYAHFSTAKLQPLYLSEWDINNLTNAASMFWGYAYNNDQGDPVIYATDWSAKTGIDASNMFYDSKIKNANNVTVGQNQLSYAKTEDTGCFTKAEFYAVFNSGTLTFYYDGYNGKETPLKPEAMGAKDWVYDTNRANVTNVVIDASVANYHGLKSTTYMFYNMQGANNITGCEYLDVSNVTNMSNMFNKYAASSTSITAVPDVSKWNTSNVTNMDSMFYTYAKNSKSITDVPDVSKWNTSKVTNMKYMFSKYAYCSEGIQVVPDVSKWNTSKVTYMSEMFSKYAYSSPYALDVLDLSTWCINSLETADNMFSYYNYKAEKPTYIYATNWTVKQGVTAKNMFAFCRTLISCEKDDTNQWSATRCFTSYYTISDIENQTYTGSEITPSFIVKVSDKTLIKDTDYTVSYSNNIYAGLANITITGIGKYEGHEEVFYFNIQLKVSGTTIDNKTYDRTTDATAKAGTLVGFVSGDDVAIDQVTADFEDKNAGEGKTVTVTYTLKGKDAAKYLISGEELKADITPKTLTVTGTSIDNKTYDGKTNATAKAGTLVDFVSGDDVAIDQVTAEFDNKNVGEEKTVTVNYTLKGSDADNYTVQEGSSTADITPKELEVSGTTISNKVYDGTTAATAKAGTLVDFVSGDDVEIDQITAEFEDKNAGEGKEVTVTFTLKGADADNYTVQDGSSTADITPKELEVSGTTVSNKVYDGTTDATVNAKGTLKGVIGTDDVSIDTATGIFKDKDAGKGKEVTIAYTLKGTDAANYTASEKLSADITKRSVTITSASDSKTYDGTPLTNHNVTVSGEDFVQGEGASFDVYGSQTEVGSSPNEFDYTLNSNTKAGNYNITKVEGTITVNKRKVILTSGSAVKEFDRTALTNFDVTESGDGWMLGDGASYNVTGTVTYVSTVKNEFTYTLNQGTQADHYDIEIVFGDLTITNQKKQDVLMHLDETIDSLLEINDEYDDIIKNGVKELKDFEYEESESYAQNVRRIDKVANEIKKNNANARLEYCKDEANKLKKDVDQIIEEDNSSWLIKVTKFIGNATRKFFNFSLGNSLSILQRNVQKFFNVIF